MQTVVHTCSWYDAAVKTVFLADFYHCVFDVAILNAAAHLLLWLVHIKVVAADLPVAHHMLSRQGEVCLVGM